MSVYKEGYKIVETIINRSKQIWDDSVDFGVLVNKGDANWNMVNQLVTQYGLPETRKQTNYGLKNELRDLEVVVELMDEWNTGRIEPFKVYYTSVQTKVNGVKWDGLITVIPMDTREPEKLKCTCKPGHPYNNLTCEIHGNNDR